MTKASQRDGIN